MVIHKGEIYMATSKEYKEFILEQLDLLDNITCKSMIYVKLVTKI